MSMHVEWMEAKHTSISACAPGVGMGESETDAEVTVVFGSDDAFCLEGSILEVRARLMRALYLLNHPEEWEQPDE